MNLPSSCKNKYILLMNFQISLKPPYNSKTTFTCLEVLIFTFIYQLQIRDLSWMSFKHMHYISTFNFLHIDPFPTLLLKSCINQLIFPITTIINLSMLGGVVPRDLKQALVNPLIKTQTLCKMTQRIILSSYLQSQFSVKSIEKSCC